MDRTFKNNILNEIDKQIEYFNSLQNELNHTSQNSTYAKIINKKIERMKMEKNYIKSRPPFDY
jgi:DNA-binding transcriptional regulator GbsR (MarR family)